MATLFHLEPVMALKYRPKTKGAIPGAARGPGITQPFDCKARVSRTGASEVGHVSPYHPLNGVFIQHPVASIGHPRDQRPLAPVTSALTTEPVALGPPDKCLLMI